MKFLLCVFLVAISCQVILCDDAKIVEMINTAIPQIIRGGVADGKLPGGPYYVHHIIKSSIGAQDSHLTLDVRQLDNQTVVTVKATIDNTDFSVKTSCFTAKIGENIMALTQGWEFDWFYYAPHGSGDYCYTLEELRQGTIYEVRADQLASDNVIKLTYEYLQEAKNGDWKKDILDELDQNVPAGPYYIEVASDFVRVYQFVGRETGGEYDYYMSSVYQPCTGERYVFYNVNMAY